MLELDKVNTFYGNIQSLWDISIKVEEAEVIALVGANGAGKTTLLKTISGLLRPASGNITFLGKKIVSLPSYTIGEMGISHVPEGGRIFSEMSVLENLEMGAYALHAWKRRKETLEYVYHLFPRLKERERQFARTLSGGERQMLVMGMGLMSRPKLCMIDEPSYGLAPRLVKDVFRIINSLREEGITVLLVEQNVNHTLEVADRAYVLENGQMVLEGCCEELSQSDYVRKAYMGM